MSSHSPVSGHLLSNKTTKYEITRFRCVSFYDLIAFMALHRILNDERLVLSRLIRHAAHKAEILFVHCSIQQSRLKFNVYLHYLRHYASMLLNNCFTAVSPSSSIMSYKIVRKTHYCLDHLGYQMQTKFSVGCNHVHVIIVHNIVGKNNIIIIKMLLMSVSRMIL